MRIASKLNEKAVKTQLRDFSGVRRGRRQWQQGALNRGGDSIILVYWIVSIKDISLNGDLGLRGIRGYILFCRYITKLQAPLLVSH